MNMEKPPQSAGEVLDSDFAVQDKPSLEGVETTPDVDVIPGSELEMLDKPTETPDVPAGQQEKPKGQDVQAGAGEHILGFEPGGQAKAEKRYEGAGEVTPNSEAATAFIERGSLSERERMKAQDIEAGRGEGIPGFTNKPDEMSDPDFLKQKAEKGLEDVYKKAA